MERPSGAPGPTVGPGKNGKSLTYSGNHYICPHFHQKTFTEMIRKFAVLAIPAALLVACGGATEGNMEEKAKAAADSAAAAQAKIEADMKAAAANVVDSAAAAANAVVDSAASAAGAAVDAAKEAAGH